jgi:serine/threonine-protein kinase
MAHETVSPFDIGPGKVVGDRFEVLRGNRQGGLSTAFEVVDREDGERRELQLFPPSLFEGAEEANEFAAAWKPWLRVDSQHVLRVRDIVLAGPQGLLLVTDLPAGECMRDLVQRLAPLAPAAVVELGLELLDGLIAIHAHGLVHGDVKPQTVWVAGDAPNRSATLVDGGTTPGLWAAKDLGDRTALIGTPYYAPVEQFGGDAPTVQSDVYNVATLLFELATGVQPWAGKNFLAVFQAKLERVPPKIRERAPEIEVPAALEEAIRGGLFADKSERYPTAAAFREALAACA